MQRIQNESVGGQEEPDTLGGWDGLPLGASGPLTCDGEWAFHVRPKTTYAKPQDIRARSSWCERQAVLRRVTHPLPRSSEAATTSCLVTDVPHPQCLASCLGGPSPGLSRGRLSHALGPVPSSLPVPGLWAPAWTWTWGVRKGGRNVGVSFNWGGAWLCDSAGSPLDAQECGWREEPAGH